MCVEGQNTEFSVLLLILCTLVIDERCWHMLLEAFRLALCFEPRLTRHIKSPSQDLCSSYSKILLAGPSSGVLIEEIGVDLERKCLSPLCCFVFICPDSVVYRS